MIPRCLLNRGMTVAATAATGAIVLCGIGVAVRLDIATAAIQQLSQILGLKNAPLCICIVAWSILIAGAAAGYPPSKVQYATVILFFGTVIGVFSTLSSIDVASALAQRLLSLL